jgi:hypothetical protein
LGSNPHPQFGTVPGTRITQSSKSYRSIPLWESLLSILILPLSTALESKSPLELLMESAHKQSLALKANTESTLKTKDQPIKQSPDSSTESSVSLPARQPNVCVYSTLTPSTSLFMPLKSLDTQGSSQGENIPPFSGHFAGSNVRYLWLSPIAQAYSCPLSIPLLLY